MKSISDERSYPRIGELVKRQFLRLFSERIINQEEIMRLLTVEYSKKTFELSLPVLRKVTDSQPLIPQLKINGHSRYWKSIVELNGSKYVICKEWREEKRKGFLAWLSKFGISV